MFSEIYKKAFKSLSRLKWYGFVFLITLVFVLIVRTFFIQSYTVSSSGMETALYKGDKLLVSKITYGVRLPITILAVPFTFDKFLGFKSYSGLLKFKYRRIFGKSVEHNDIVLYNNPLEVDIPIDRRSLNLSRCFASPGDTIRVSGSDLFINGVKYIPPPDLLVSFRYPIERFDTLRSIMSLFNIPERITAEDRSSKIISLNRHEAYIIDQKLNQTILLEEIKDVDRFYSLVIPSKGMSLNLNEYNLKLYRHIIEQEIKSQIDIKFENEQLVKENAVLTSYQFNDDYYWLISDNTNEALDSRFFGFISEKYIIGKASFIWFSSDKNGIRWKRFFSSVL